LTYPLVPIGCYLPSPAFCALSRLAARAVILPATSPKAGPSNLPTAQDSPVGSP